MWFDRGAALQMDYTAAYWTMLDDLEPRWHGSHEEMLRFARECVETERYDTPVPQILFDAVSRIESNEHDAGHPGEGVYRRWAVAFVH
jgi:hypothetical protein